MTDDDDDDDDDNVWMIEMKWNEWANKKLKIEKKTALNLIFYAIIFFSPFSPSITITTFTPLNNHTWWLWFQFFFEVPLLFDTFLVMFNCNDDDFVIIIVFNYRQAKKNCQLYKHMIIDNFECKFVLNVLGIYVQLTH